MRIAIRIILALLTAMVLLQRAQELRGASGFPFARSASTCSVPARR